MTDRHDWNTADYMKALEIQDMHNNRTKFQGLSVYSQQFAQNAVTYNLDDFASVFVINSRQIGNAIVDKASVLREAKLQKKIKLDFTLLSEFTE